MFRGPYLLALFLGLVVVSGMIGVFRPMRSAGSAPKQEVLVSGRMMDTLRK
jgi:hypothetical protein